MSRVLTDNGSCCRSYAFKDALVVPEIERKSNRSYRPKPTAKFVKTYRGASSGPV